jgi:hypothetical protein
MVALLESAATQHLADEQSGWTVREDWPLRPDAEANPPTEYGTCWAMGCARLAMYRRTRLPSLGRMTRPSASSLGLLDHHLATPSLK